MPVCNARRRKHSDSAGVRRMNALPPPACDQITMTISRFLLSMEAAMRFAIRAKSLITLAQEAPARGLEALEAPVTRIRDGVVTVNGLTIETVEPYANFRQRCRTQGKIPVVDVGDKCLAPGLINSHCHLELCHIAGQSTRGLGFVPWLRSIVSLVATPPGPEQLQAALRKAAKQLNESYTAHVGDVGSRAPLLVSQALAQSALPPESVFSGWSLSHERASGSSLEITMLPHPSVTATHFLEVLGFTRPIQVQPASENENDIKVPPELDADGYTPPVAATLSQDRRAACALSGHALYSTGPAALKAAHSWCLKNNKPFSLHLAEFPEETELLQHGSGALYDYIHNVLLPAGWQAPGRRPVPLARDLGLLGPEALAIHCTQCEPEDLDILASTKTNCCLCPRSNAYIGTGEAPACEMAKAGILLCLGTDGLSSNEDVSIVREMDEAGKLWGFSRAALLRMVTVNAAHALGLSSRLGSLGPGKSAFFSVFSEI